MAELFEDICPRCLEPHMVDGDTTVGSFCPKCQSLSFYGVPVNQALNAIAFHNSIHQSGAVEIVRPQPPKDVVVQRAEPRIVSHLFTTERNGEPIAVYVELPEGEPVPVLTDAVGSTYTYEGASYNDEDDD